MLEVSVIIVNFNTGDLIKNCLESVFSQKDINLEVIVVDNASHDQSVEIMRGYQDKVTLIYNQENVGFGRANNQGVRVAKGRYLFLFNPDAVLEGKMALAQMVEYMQSNPRFGLVGTQVIKGKGGGYSIPQVLYPAQKYTSLSFSFLPGEIAWVIGASMMVRRDVFEQVKGFDEDFFLYGEEADLCFRIRKIGFSIGYYAEVAVRHLGGGSERSTSSSELWRKKQNGLHLFMRKNYPAYENEKILSLHIRRAKRKLFFLSFQKLCGLFTEEKQKSYERYQVVLETSEKMLHELLKSSLLMRNRELSH
ncbi:MAG: glycosyltransferase family 2 protein [Gammaproteobacteria bacterium]|nr:glycosyltransferase family 2 protein [Gammaproteobacteria bacterium]